MEIRKHPNQEGYILTMADGTEYATQEGDQYFEAAHREFTGEKEALMVPMEMQEYTFV